MTVGDSKTARDGWQSGLIALMNTAEPTCVWTYNLDVSYGGATLTTMAAGIDALLSAYKEPPPTYILSNLGVNGLLGSEEEKVRYQYIIDALHTKFPAALIFIAKPWKVDYDDRADGFATMVDELVDENPLYTAVGHDERIWAKGADNGATMLDVGGVHYSTAGNVECGIQWATLIEAVF